MNQSKPNLFSYATSELSQDAFLAWLMAWGAPHYAHHGRMHEVACSFINKLITAGGGEPVERVETIEIKKQFSGKVLNAGTLRQKTVALDLLVLLNRKYAILIEDKTFTSEGDDQLANYAEIVRNHVEPARDGHPELRYGELEQIRIYYKIADQNNQTNVKNAGFTAFTRNMMLDFMKANPVSHPLFEDYQEHLSTLHNRYQSYLVLPPNEWDGFSWQGFYHALSLAGLNGKWGYVANQQGGFHAFWWSPEDGEHYFQLDQNVACVKIVVEEKKMRGKIRDEKMTLFLGESERAGSLFVRPSRLGTGRTMTIAVKTDYLQIQEDGLVDVEQTVRLLKRIQMNGTLADDAQQEITEQNI